MPRLLCQQSGLAKSPDLFVKVMLDPVWLAEFEMTVATVVPPRPPKSDQTLKVFTLSRHELEASNVREL